MNRIQFIEIQDQSWCPKAIRDALTETLQFTLNMGNQYAPAVQRLRTALERAGTKEVVDLCSGAGGPWLRLLRANIIAATTRMSTENAASRTSGATLTDSKDPAYDPAMPSTPKTTP